MAMKNGIYSCLGCCSGILNNIISMGVFSNPSLILADIENQKIMKTFKLKKEESQYISTFAQKNFEIFAGLITGGVKMYDYRINNSLADFLFDEKNDGGADFSPVSFIDLNESHQLLVTSSNKVSLFDIRMNKEIHSILDLSHNVLYNFNILNYFFKLITKF